MKKEKKLKHKLEWYVWYDCFIRTMEIHTIFKIVGVHKWLFMVQVNDEMIWLRKPKDVVPVEEIITYKEIE